MSSAKGHHAKRSTVSLGTILKGVRILGPHPWIFTKLLHLQAAKHLFPLTRSRAGKGLGGRIHQVSIRITDLCNLRCHTCGQWGDRGFLHGQDLRELHGREVGCDRYRELFADLVSNGQKPNVYLWGGEPTMYSGFSDVITSATELGLPTSIATNGHRLREVAPLLVQAPLFLLQVSVDGHDGETHNRARPSAAGRDSYRDVREGLEAVKRIKRERRSTLPMVASLTVVSQQNIDHLVDIYNSLKDYVDVCVFYLSWWIDEESALKHDADFSRRFGFAPHLHRGWIGGWRPRDYALLEKRLHQVRTLADQNRSGPAVTILPDLESAAELEKYYCDHTELFGYRQCISIFQAVEIDSNGDMSPCRDYHDYVVGNVKERTITELWNGSDFRCFRKSLKNDGLMPVCSRCCGLMGY